MGRDCACGVRGRSVSGLYEVVTERHGALSGVSRASCRRRVAAVAPDRVTGVDSLGVGRMVGADWGGRHSRPRLAPGCPGGEPFGPGVSQDSPLDAVDGVWWVVHTRARHEKALAADLDRTGVGNFLPLVRVQRRYGGRTTEADLPLFPGYLFFCGGEDERYATLATDRVARVIRVVDQDRLKAELGRIFRLVSSDVPVDLYPGIRRGRRCRVAGGCLKGLEGVVLRRRGRCCVHVSIDALGQSAEVEIDTSLLELID